ncbi:MAG: CBS domain-containing protein [Rhodospirillaceae bacterium]|jgi:signal-transduction protein with cAMP-binding, CBS, and nucleotidyltransferase domain|nr:CBS domain-containing protein [Rhodospirillaceae bacterium]
MTEKKIIRVSDVMSKGVIKVERSATVHEVVRLMSERRISSVIVERRDEDDEFGLVAVADIARDVLAKDLSPERVNVYEIMSKPVLTLAAEMNVMYAVRMLSRFQLARALVVDHDRNPLGVVTLRDMVLRSLEDE